MRKVASPTRTNQITATQLSNKHRACVTTVCETQGGQAKSVTISGRHACVWGVKTSPVNKSVDRQLRVSHSLVCEALLAIHPSRPRSQLRYAMTMSATWTLRDPPPTPGRGSDDAPEDKLILKILEGTGRHDRGQHRAGRSSSAGRLSASASAFTPPKRQFHAPQATILRENPMKISHFMPFFAQKSPAARLA